MLNRRTFMRLGMSSAALFLAASCGTQAQVEMLSMERLTLPIRHLNPAHDGFKIVVMSDFHIRMNSDLALYESAAEMTNNLEPDLVLLLGDYVNSSASPIEQLSPILGEIHATYGLFAAMGNHEYDSDPGAIMRSLEEHDIQVLRNAGTVVGDDILYIGGLDDVWFERHNIERTLNDKPALTPAIMMAHEPDIADEIAQTGEVALQLSGHSHGGQVRLPLLGAPILPQLGQKYDMGLYEIEQMWLYTTRGVGTNNMPYRVNCPPEITEITLVAADMDDDAGTI